jgi:hypothetical protein
MGSALIENPDGTRDAAYFHSANEASTAVDRPA